jgi:acylphosphatase
MAEVRAHVYISGQVQGVFFRASAHSEAKKLGLTGWIRNILDGQVEAVFEGEEEKVKEMVAWCGRGPEGAQVSGVDVKYEPATKEFSGFIVKRSLE